MPGKKNLLHYFPDSLLRKVKWLRARERGIDEIESNSISSMAVRYIEWIWIILESFGHFLSILCENESIHYEIEVGCLIPDSRR